jgi:hypothetical protein
MFVGHFAIGLAAKRAASRANLAVPLFAPQLLDFVWPIGCALGIQQVRIVPDSRRQVRPRPVDPRLIRPGL